MSLHLIELNDHKVRISLPSAAPTKVLLESPGYANTVNGSPAFGDAALQLSRLHPRHSYNHFWSQLSMDPLAHSDNNFRHQADLAYGHLCQLVSSCDLDDEVIFAIPSHYNRTQLAILLGLVGQSPFQAVGLVDLALLNIANTIEKSSIYIDFQLHQTVLTSIVVRDGRLVREKVVPIAGAGLLALHDAWANMVTDAFVKQCRFDPQHNAETEQFVYSQLPNWIASSMANNEVLLEINNKGTVYQASVNLVNFQQRASRIYSRIQTEVDTIVQPDTIINLPTNMHSLPGLTLEIPHALPLVDSSSAENCFTYLSQIQHHPEALGFITSLDLIDNKQSETIIPDTVTPDVDNKQPSHLLFNHKAYALPTDTVYLGASNTEQITSNAEVAFIEIDDPELLTPISIIHQAQGYVLQHQDNVELLLNSTKLTENAVLSLGDKIEFTNSTSTIQFIKVQ